MKERERKREREMTGERDFFYCALICGTQLRLMVLRLMLLELVQKLSIFV